MGGCNLTGLQGHYPAWHLPKDRPEISVQPHTLPRVSLVLGTMNIGCQQLPTHSAGHPTPAHGVMEHSPRVGDDQTEEARTPFLASTIMMHGTVASVSKTKTGFWLTSKLGF